MRYDTFGNVRYVECIGNEIINYFLCAIIKSINLIKY